MPISENETLFQLIGTTYGGDGESTFNLPNLQSRIPIHMGTGPAGSPISSPRQAGTEAVTLTTQQIPSHTHPLVVSNDIGAARPMPPTQFCRRNRRVSIYRPEASPPNVAMNAPSITPVGGSQPHENMQPFLCINYIISLFGIFPSPDLEQEDPQWPIPFVAEIRIFPFNFAPKGWAFCNGQLMPLSQNTALVLAARHHLWRRRQVAPSPCRTSQGTVAHASRARARACRSASSARWAAPSSSPCSNRRCRPTPTPLNAIDVAVSTTAAPSDQTRRSPEASAARSTRPTADGGPLTQMAPEALPPAGGSLPHNNLQPYLTLNYCIALQGVFPARPMIYNWGAPNMTREKSSHLSRRNAAGGPGSRRRSSGGYRDAGPSTQLDPQAGREGQLVGPAVHVACECRRRRMEPPGRHRVRPRRRNRRQARRGHAAALAGAAPAGLRDGAFVVGLRIGRRGASGRAISMLDVSHSSRRDMKVYFSACGDACGGHRLQAIFN